MNLIENGLVPIYEHNGNRVINARELHEKLQIVRDFPTWIKDKLEKNGFIEGTDYSSFPQTVERAVGGSRRIEYALTVDVGKELAMLEGNEIGRKVRRYFIEAEKRLQMQQPMNIFDVMKRSLDIIQAHEQQLQTLTGSVQTIKDTICDRPEDWRAEVNEMLNKAAYRAGGGDKYREIKQWSYDELDRRGAARIEIRLDNMKERVAGKIPKKAYEKLCYLDVIAEDKRLREIYWQIVKEISIKYSAA